jgi:hypothetical protein
MEHVQQIAGSKVLKIIVKHTPREQRNQDVQGKDGLINDAKTSNTALP